MARAGAKKEVKSLIKTKADPQYREIMQKVNQDFDYYGKVIAKATGTELETAKNEVAALYADCLSKKDNLYALALENVVYLQFKQKIGMKVKQERFAKALQEATENGDTETVEEIEAQMLDDLMDVAGDSKVIKLLNDTMKTAKAMEDRVVTVRTQSSDDKMVFDVSDGVYTEE